MQFLSMAVEVFEGYQLVEMDAPDHWANFDYVRDESEMTSEPISSTTTTTSINTSIKNEEKEGAGEKKDNGNA